MEENIVLHEDVMALNVLFVKNAFQKEKNQLLIKNLSFRKLKDIFCKDVLFHYLFLHLILYLVLLEFF